MQYLYNENEFSKIYAIYVDIIFKICMMFLKDKASAQDATQEVFLKFINNKKPFDSEEHLKAWFIVTSQNYCKSKLRTWWYQKRVNLDDILEPSYTPVTTPPLLHMILTLPNSLKTIIYMYYYEEYRISEIALMLNLNENTIKSRLALARKKMREKIGENDYV